jgi:diketogulonate reductase-like aldo/keto reductase
MAAAASIPTISAQGARIPALGFGTSPQTGALAADEVVAALKAGYRHIDTARKYGTERQVGEALRASGVPRGEIFLVTKVSHENLRAADFARSVDDSLKALKVDYVDLLMVHWPNPEIALSETMPALAKAKRDGLARHVGIANFNTTLLDQAIRLCPEPLVALQAEYHPGQADRRDAPAWHGVRRLLPARSRPDVQRSGAGRDRQGARPKHRPGRAALVDAAGHHSDPALVQARAHRRQSQGDRLHAVR